MVKPTSFADPEEYLALSEDKRAEWLKDKGYTAEDFADDVLDDGNELDNSGEIRYTIKHNSEAITKQDYKTLESDIMTWYMNQKGKILTHFKNGYDYYFIVNKDADSNGYMFTILSKSKAVNIHERETYYDEYKQNRERFDSFVSDFRSEQESSEFNLLSTDGRRAEGTNRETNSRETEQERVDGRDDSRNGFESGWNNQASKKVVRYDFENRTITYKDGTTAKFSLKDSGEIRYSFKGKKTARYINKKLDTPTLSFIRNELSKMYGPIDSAIADGIAIEKDNTIFVVDSGIEGSEIDFGVKSVKTISDNDLRKEYIRRKYDEAIRKGHISYELSSRFGDEYVDSWNGYRRLKFGKELSTNKEQSTNNERKFSKGNGNDGRGRLTFSLKDSDGNTLSLSQR